MGNPKPRLVVWHGEDIVCTSMKIVGAPCAPGGCDPQKLCKQVMRMEGCAAMTDLSWTLYCHKNKENGRRYYGITSQSPERRWMKGLGYSEHLPIGRAIRKYGWENFEHNIVFENLSERAAKTLEKLYIAMYETQHDEHGYNMTCGGDGVVGYHHSDISRRKMSAAKRGSNHPNWGRHLSDETCKKISEAHTGKISPLKGISISESHKQHISEAKYKSVAAYDDDENLVFTFPSARHAAQALGVNYRNISLSIHGERKHCGGYKWKFA